MFGFNVIGGVTEVIAEDGTVLRAEWVASVAPEPTDREREFRARLLAHGEEKARKLAAAHYRRACAALDGAK